MLDDKKQEDHGGAPSQTSQKTKKTEALWTSKQKKKKIGQKTARWKIMVIIFLRVKSKNVKWGKSQIEWEKSSCRVSA